MTTDGGGWTVFQRRVDATSEFYLGWTDFVAGFGELSHNLWLGLCNLNVLTQIDTELRVDMQTATGTKNKGKPRTGI